jgi:hypothetical protein
MRTLTEKLSAVDWSTVRDREAYVAVASRNAVADARRQAQAAQRRVKREAQRAAEVDALAAARQELAGLISDYRTVCAQGDIEAKWLLALSVLVGATTDTEIRATHGVSRDVVYQWRRRGLLLLDQDFSNNLRSHLATRLMRPPQWSVGSKSLRRRPDYLAVIGEPS